jgi:hypothetical protein
MRTANINVTKIDKTALYEGKNGKYLSLVFFDNKEGPDQFGNDGFVTQDLGKERRMAGEKGPIIGNWKEVGTKRPAPAPTRHESSVIVSMEDHSDIPF